MPSSRAACWAALSHACPHLSPASIMDAFGTAEAVFDAAPSEITERLALPPPAVRRLLAAETRAAAEAVVEAAAVAGQQVLSFGDVGYPRRLREIPDPPPVLFIAGEVPPVDAPAVAVVGSRRCTVAAAEVARGLGRDLARQGFVVVSGGALGVDAAVHEGVLEAGGCTIAVRGSGLDIDYPRGHADLYRRLEGVGCSAAEIAPGTRPRPAHFPRRNRIISGWSLGVVVVEAGLRSGALVTARLALEQGREVFAVPGSLDNPMAAGTNLLIQQGAKLITCAEDVTEELTGQLLPHPAERVDAPGGQDPALQDPTARAILRGLRDGDGDVDALAGRLNKGTGEILATLLRLELVGWVAPVHGGRFRLGVRAPMR